jgi:hypothetical protein
MISNEFVSESNLQFLTEQLAVKQIISLQRKCSVVNWSQERGLTFSWRRRCWCQFTTQKTNTDIVTTVLVTFTRHNNTLPKVDTIRHLLADAARTLKVRPLSFHMDFNLTRTFYHSTSGKWGIKWIKNPLSLFTGMSRSKLQLITFQRRFRVFRAANIKVVAAGYCGLRSRAVW